MEKKTWIPAHLPSGCKWIFKNKLRPDRSEEKYKARLVANENTQKKRID